MNDGSAVRRRPLFAGPKRMTYDAAPGDEVSAGNVLVTVRGHRWLVVSARKMQSKYPNRYALEVVRTTAERSAVAHLLPLRWYPRGPKRRQPVDLSRFGAQPLPWAARPRGNHGGP